MPEQLATVAEPLVVARSVREIPKSGAEMSVWAQQMKRASEVNPNRP